MAYMVFTKDKQDAAHIRAEHRQAHMDYLASWEPKLIASGGVQTESGEFNAGLIIIDVNSLEEAKAFIEGDPFGKAGLFGEITVSKWVQTYLHGRLDREPFQALAK
ncbi:hypothetical protein JAU75_20665 [Ochrobactrum sp. Q0168]|uniref:YciI family protein n=1 Tax=Ochrobactrum sp. Q0168 TaxID=2793241 RepID=UPI0018EE3942|nr:hypothetical protein [Ochrobactrum sp. Q0168]